MQSTLGAIFSAALALTLALGPAFAQGAAPVAAPVSRDAAVAMAAAAQGDWDVAYALAPAAQPVVRDLVTWLRLREGEAQFDDYVAFFAARPDWPDQSRLRARAEEALVKGTSPDIVRDFFASQPPQTGEGALRLAEALYASGLKADADAVLREAWLSLSLTDEAHDALIAAFADTLAPHHAARTDALLWRWRTTDAARMLPLLAPDQRALAEARIAYISKTAAAGTADAAVPAALRDHPGLAYDRYNWLADKGERTQAVQILAARSTSAAALGEPFRWSGWRRSLARLEMREGRAESAYALASQHFLTEGDAFVDLEWLAGFIALRYLDDPTLALTHFARAGAAVTSPISEGRMEYWSARAHEALGDTAAATAAFTTAAQHQTGFYGLLAAEVLGLPLDPALTGAAEPTDWQGAPVLSQDLVQAGLLLIDAGQRAPAVPFFVALGTQLDAANLSRLATLLVAMDEPYFAVVLGKSAVTQGVLSMRAYYPDHPLAQTDLPVPPALAMSIARRESEFNYGVGSPVGALGLMQLMPATAEEVAGELGLPYSRARLTSDWRYNATLGSAYLAGLTDRFGPSPVQIAIGYNAGASRADQWMDERGDPRLGEADVVDWIEHIPFRETRNYVMRVAESIPIYEARLTGQAGPVRFTPLLIGEKPIVRPLARPDGSLVREVPTTGPLRPLARPEG